jgi:hypothetical protein
MNDFLSDNFNTTVKTVDLEEFTQFEDLFNIEIKYGNTIYNIKLSSLFETTLNNDGTFNEADSRRKQELIITFLGELNTIRNRLQEEYDNLSINLEKQMSIESSIAETRIEQERKILVDNKLKKEIGQITEKQILSNILKNDTNDEITTTKKHLAKLKRQTLTIFNLQEIMKQKLDTLPKYTKTYLKD